MSFATNENQQISLYDPSFFLTDRERRMLEKSWAVPFGELVFPAIDEKPCAVLYSSKVSRPNTPVNVLVGALILKELLGGTDDELVESLVFDIRYQVALHTTSFKEQPLSDRSLSRFRARNTAYEEKTGTDLLYECVCSLKEEIAKVQERCQGLKKLDALTIALNIKNLSRLELLYSCTANLAEKIAASSPKLLPEELLRYCDGEEKKRMIDRGRSEKTRGRIRKVTEDAREILALCAGDYDDTSEYHLLLRIIKEQEAASQREEP